MTVVRSSPILALLAFSLCGCGSAIETHAFDDDAAAIDPGDASADTTGNPPADGDVDALATETAADAIAADAIVADVPADVLPETPTPTTIDNVCSRLVDAICAQPTKDCCTRRSIGYDAGGCQKAVIYWCGGLAAQVKAAQRTFNGAQFDACASAWRSLETTCSVPFVDYVKQYAPCSQLFPGTLAAGKTCKADTDCIAPIGGVAFCDKSSNVCGTVLIAPKGAACSYGQNALVLCDAGNYCPAASNAKCKTATPVGGACTGVNDTSCGIGFQCAASASGGSRCRAGLPVGAQCTNGLQCASWQCDGLAPLGGSGTCSDPYAQLASPAICQGVP